jgi:XapX domain-containing protein
MDVKVVLVSFIVGLMVGVIYGVIRVKSPAPPFFALLGLFGMVLGEQGVTWILAKNSHTPKVASVSIAGERAERQ